MPAVSVLASLLVGAGWRMRWLMLGSILAVFALSACSGTDTGSTGGGTKVPVTATSASSTTAPQSSGVTDTADVACTNLRVVERVSLPEGSYPQPHVVVQRGQSTWVAPAQVFGSVTMIDQDSFAIVSFDEFDSAVMMGDRLFVGSGKGESGAIVELDPVSGETLETYPVPGRYPERPRVLGIAQGLGRLWTATGPSQLTALDPADGTVTTFEDVRTDGISLPVEAGGRMWVATDDDGIYDGVLVELGLDGSRVELPIGDTGLIPVEAGGLLYVSNFDSQSVTVVDPIAAVVVDVIGVGPGPLWPTVIDDRLFVPNSLGDSVTVINVESGGVEGEIPTGTIPSHPIAVGDYIVVPAHGGGAVTILDRLTLDVLSVVDFDGSGVPAYDYFYSSGHVDDLPYLKIGIPVSINDETVVVLGLSEPDIGMVAIDLPSGRVVDRYPDAGAVQPVVVGSNIIVGEKPDWDTAVVLGCS